jgi:PKD repeat protein
VNRPSLTYASIGVSLGLALVAAAPAAAAPTADFTVSPSTVVAGEVATLTSTSSTTAGQQIVSTEWDFDSDGTFDATGVTVTHTFAAGTHNVTLRVTDDAQETLTMIKAVTAVAPPPPTADFTVAPVPPVAGSTATFTSTSSAKLGASIALTQWDFDNDGTIDATGAAVGHVFATGGPHSVRLHVVDSRNLSSDVVRQVTVDPPPPPTADFTVAPVPPVAGSSATFTSTSSAAPGASIALTQWDFDNDGTIDATGAAVGYVFASGGIHFVRLHVVDSRNLSSDVVRQVTVNAPPIAAFTAFPTTPTVGDEVSLTSYSSDAEGALAAQQWDLDADGDYDDASGAVVTGMFTSPGAHVLSLRVRDNQGATSTVSKTVTVLAPPRTGSPLVKDDPPPKKSDDTPPASAPPFVALVSPFPIVRLVGAVVNGGARIKRLTVRAPAGSRVYVTCRGRKCPARRLTKVAGAAPVRFRALERFLPNGSVIEVLVRKGDQIGKYTSFLIRRHRVPKRVDGCLPPYASRAVKCPGD